MTERFVTIGLRVETEHQPSADEFDPFYLALYLDRNFKAPVTVLVNPHHPQPYKMANSPNLVSTTVHGQCPNHDAHGQMTTKLPADSHLCLQGYTHTTNHDGVPCRQDCGAHIIRLATVHDAYVSGTPITAELRIHTTENDMLKARIKLHVHTFEHWSPAHSTPSASSSVHVSSAPTSTDSSAVLSARILSTVRTPYDAVLYTDGPESRVVGASIAGGVSTTKAAAPQKLPVVFSPLEPYMNAASNLPHMAAEMRRYAACFLLENAQFDVVFSGTKDINCPFTPGEVTAENTQLAMPFPSFTLATTPTTSPQWWQRQWHILAERRGFKDGQQLGVWIQRQPRAIQSGIAMDLCAQLPQLLPYVSDRTAGRPIEMFSDALAMMSGDCEDLAIAILQLRNALRQQSIGGSAADPAQQLLKQIADDYVDFFCIDGVTAAHAAGAMANLEVNNAHAAIHALPRRYVAECIANWNPNHPLVAAQGIGRGGSSSSSSTQDPVLVGEGTGVLDSGVERDPCPTARAYLFEHRPLASLKKALHGEPGGESAFYKVVLFGATPEFLTEYGIGTFRFCKRNPQTGHFTRGVHYTDLARRDPGICLVPYGASDAAQAALIEGPDGLSEDATAHRAAISAERNATPGKWDHAEMTREQMRIMRSVIKTRIPPPPLSVDPINGAAHVAVPLMQMRNWCSQVNSVIQQNAPTHGKAAVAAQVNVASPVAPPGTAPVHFFPYVSQVTPAFIASLTQSMGQPNTRLIAGATCHVEAHHPRVQILRLTFFCYNE